MYAWYLLLYDLNFIPFNDDIFFLYNDYEFMNCDIAFYTDDKNYECHKCMPKIEYIYYKIFYTYEKRPLFFFYDSLF